MIIRINKIYITNIEEATEVKVALTSVGARGSLEIRILSYFENIFLFFFLTVRGHHSLLSRLIILIVHKI